MDITKLKVRIIENVSKYKYACMVLLVGIILMIIPGKEDRTQHTTEEKITTVSSEENIQQQLEEILSKVYNAGEVKVMLTISEDERTIYQSDSTYTQSDNQSDSRTQTVIVTDSQRTETGLVCQRFPPIYKGAIIIAEGGDLASVKLAIVDAVSDVTGLGADKITVLKME
jgi:stage III sporulation protein AG